MDAIELAEHFVSDHPLDSDARVLRHLLESLRARKEFELEQLYDLPLRSFELAMGVLAAWRLQRYYRGPAVASIGSRTGAH